MSSRKNISLDCLLATGGWFQPLERAIAGSDLANTPLREGASTGTSHSQTCVFHQAADRTEALNRAGRMLAILDAILALEEPDRSALILRFLERRSLKDISRLTAVAEETANKRIHHAVERLKEVLQGHFTRT
jgi:DNA-directed RNA polymerase specialized sigma24 family protein